MNLTDRLITAIVEKCDGLSISAEQASNILAYLQYGAPMTATTSKLGADMTGKITYFLEAWEMNGVGQTVATVQDSPGTVVTITVDDLRSLLARQPAAIDKEAVTKKGDKREMNGRVWICTDPDIDRWVSCGPAHFDKEASKPAAQRLETTSENIARDIREGRFPQRSEPQMVDDAAPSVEQDERGAFEEWLTAQEWNITPLVRSVALRAWQARAASTSANVAQGAKTGKGESDA